MRENWPWIVMNLLIVAGALSICLDLIWYDGYKREVERDMRERVMMHERIWTNDDEFRD
jgi:hypothetical protein